MIIITSGKKYLDIDAFACCFAYNRLLRILGENSIVLSTAYINKSVIPEFRNKDFDLFRSHKKKDEHDSFVIMDVSNPNYFEDFVELNKINMIIDHHTGFENYWKDKLGDFAKIEFIGSAATLVFEEFEKKSLTSFIDTDIAQLLMAAILDNTLNFSANITSTRDYHAYETLKNISKKENFAQYYFMKCQENINNNIIEAIKNDIKYIKIESSFYLPNCIGQLTVWDVDYIFNKMDLVISFFNSLSSRWIFNLICLKENKSYIISNNHSIQKTLEHIFNQNFYNNIIQLDYPILRKEIMKTFETI